MTEDAVQPTDIHGRVAADDVIIRDVHGNETRVPRMTPAEFEEAVRDMGPGKIYVVEDDADASLPTRAKITRHAEYLICGDRQEEYGPPEVNFKRIADGWNWWLQSTGRPGFITPVDVAEMMGLVKVARSAESPTHFDSYVDRCGYAAIAGELAGAKPGR